MDFSISRSIAFCYQTASISEALDAFLEAPQCQDNFTMALLPMGLCPEVPAESSTSGAKRVEFLLIRANGGRHGVLGHFPAKQTHPNQALLLQSTAKAKRSHKSLPGIRAGTQMPSEPEG